jgi:hypothetical protein
MAHIVVIGASTGGLPFAYDIKKTLGKNHEVTVISNNSNFIERIVFIVKSISILLYFNVGNIKHNSIKLLSIFTITTLIIIIPTPI